MEICTWLMWGSVSREKHSGEEIRGNSGKFSEDTPGLGHLLLLRTHLYKAATCRDPAEYVREKVLSEPKGKGNLESQCTLWNIPTSLWSSPITSERLPALCSLCQVPLSLLLSQAASLLGKSIMWLVSGIDRPCQRASVEAFVLLCFLLFA